MTVIQVHRNISNTTVIAGISVEYALRELFTSKILRTSKNEFVSSNSDRQMAVVINLCIYLYLQISPRFQFSLLRSSLINARNCLILVMVTINTKKTQAITFSRRRQLLVHLESREYHLPDNDFRQNVDLLSIQVVLQQKYLHCSTFELVHLQEHK